MRVNKKLASSQELIAQETGRDAKGARVGIAFVGKRSYVLAAFADEIVLVPVRPTIPVRRLPDAEVLTFPWATVDVVRGRKGFAYSGFDLVAPAAQLRLHVARPWRELIEELDVRAAPRQPER